MAVMNKGFLRCHCSLNIQCNIPLSTSIVLASKNQLLKVDQQIMQSTNTSPFFFYMELECPQILVSVGIPTNSPLRL